MLGHVLSAIVFSWEATNSPGFRSVPPRTVCSADASRVITCAAFTGLLHDSFKLASRRPKCDVAHYVVADNALSLVEVHLARSRASLLVL